jgi:hypothetical protein
MKTHTIDAYDDLLPDSVRRFHSLFERFKQDLDNALDRADKEYSQHMPSKGQVCEAAFRKYLTETLGSRYSVTDGFVFDSTGQQSKQQDVIIYDDHWSIRLTPRDSDEPPIIPVESVYATVEVKKVLNSQELRDAVQNIRSFRKLVRESVGPQNVTPNKSISNLGLPDSNDIRNPYLSAIFGFKTDRSPEKVVEQLKREVAAIPVLEWPDLVILHGKGVILPYCQECGSSAAHISKITRDGHTPTYFLDRLDGAYSILGFHLLLMQHLHFTILKSINFNSMYGALCQVARFLSQAEKTR